MNNGTLQINELTAILTEHFQWNKARIACFVGMLIALMAVSTINLAQLAVVFPSRVKVRMLPFNAAFSNAREEKCRGNRIKAKRACGRSLKHWVKSGAATYSLDSERMTFLLSCSRR